MAITARTNQADTAVASTRRGSVIRVARTRVPGCMARLAHSRVLPVVLMQQRVQLWVMPLHLQGFIEEVLGNYREEFPRIRAAICVQKSALSLRGAAAQLVVLACANLDPALVLPVIGQGRRPIDASVEHVELVGELVIHNVVASLGMDGTAQYGVPDQHNRTTQDRLAVDRDPRPLYRDAGGERRGLSGRDDCGGIDQDSL